MFDIMLNQESDLEIANGDFVTAKSTHQHQRILLMAQKGDIRQFPSVGVGIETFLNAERPGDILVDIRSQFERDGMKVEQLSEGATGSINVTAEYK